MEQGHENTMISQFKGHNHSIWESFRLHLRDPCVPRPIRCALDVPIEQKRLPKDYVPFCRIYSPLWGHGGSSRLLKESVTRSKSNEELCRCRNRVL